MNASVHGDVDCSEEREVKCLDIRMGFGVYAFWKR
jgi:hypothetical protein